jgi:hypothetical protein
MVPPGSRHIMEGFDPFVALEHEVPHTNTERIGRIIEHVIECGILRQSMIERKFNLAIEFVAFGEDFQGLLHHEIVVVGLYRCHAVS